MVTLAPAGMMTRPRESVTLLLTVVVTTSPCLLLRELISWSTAVAMTVPEGNTFGAGAGAGAGVGRGVGLAATGLAGAAGAAGAGRSSRTAEESAGMRCRSRVRLSAAILSGLSPTHAANSVTAKSDSRLAAIPPPKREKVVRLEGEILRPV